MGDEDKREDLSLKAWLLPDLHPSFQLCFSLFVTRKDHYLNKMQTVLLGRKIDKQVERGKGQKVH